MRKQLYVYEFIIYSGIDGIFSDFLVTDARKKENKAESQQI